MKKRMIQKKNQLSRFLQVLPLWQDELHSTLFLEHLQRLSWQSPLHWHLTMPCPVPTERVRTIPRKDRVMGGIWLRSNPEYFTLSNAFLSSRLLIIPAFVPISYRFSFSDKMRPTTLAGSALPLSTSGTNTATHSPTAGWCNFPLVLSIILLACFPRFSDARLLSCTAGCSVVDPSSSRFVSLVALKIILEIYFGK